MNHDTIGTYRMGHITKLIKKKKKIKIKIKNKIIKTIINIKYKTYCTRCE